MLWILDQLSYHRLNDPNISIQDTSRYPTSEGYPKIGREPDDEQRDHGTCAPEKEDWFATDSI
jgi:hypothetical protein